MIENGTLLQDRYLIEKQIGAGGMGAVYLAVDRRFENHVAIKETFFKDDEFGDAFEREARLLNGLQHPALPHVSDYFTDKHGHFLVMQFIEGEDLSAILKREGSFPVSEVLRWTDSLLDALDYLHSQEPPVIHRDIKPQNLKITPRGEIILLDFGLAKLKLEDISGVNSVFGYSRKYSPLEQIQGTGTDARSDIFSLAATAYHLLTGKPPIDVLARAAEIVVGNPDPLELASDINTEVPVAVANILNSALALNASRRFVSAKAMRQALEHAVSIDSAEFVEESPEQPLPVVLPIGKVVDSGETENFPALEAFVAESAESIPSEYENNKAEPIEIPVSGAVAPPEMEIPHPKNNVIEIPTRVAARNNGSRLPLAIAAALLIFVAIAAGYFINKTSSASEPEQVSEVQTISEANTDPEQSAPLEETPLNKESAATIAETVEQAKTKPVEIEKAVAEKETDDEPEIKVEAAEKEKPQTEQSEPPRAKPAQNPRRSDSPRQNQPPRSVESEPIPDIESIFTGRPSRAQNDRIRSGEERRRRADEMTEEEFEELRRQRRQERRRRQNRPPLPY